MLNMSEFSKKALISGFSCVNTRLAFHTEILIDDKGSEKVLFNLNIDAKKKKKKKKIKKGFNKDTENGWKQSVWASHDKNISIWVY